MKNPKNKPLRIVTSTNHFRSHYREYGIVLSNLAIAESNLVKAGKDSAMPHFIALVKEIEKHFGFTFEQIEEDND